MVQLLTLVVLKTAVSTPEGGAPVDQLAAVVHLLSEPAPFQTFGGKSPYHDLISKTAVLFYLMVKNHPFQNGNKRIAMTTLFVLLHKNRKWLSVDTQELYNFTMWIAQSPAKAKEETIKATEKFIRSHLAVL